MLIDHFAGRPGCECGICRPHLSPASTSPVVLREYGVTITATAAATLAPKRKVGNDAEPPSQWLKKSQPWDGHMDQFGSVTTEGQGWHRFDNNIKGPK